MTQLLKGEDYFESSDIAFCAALHCYGYQIEIIDTNNPSRAIFYIKRDKRLDEIKQAYFSHRLKVDPLTYFNTLKEIKTRIYHT